MNVLITGGAGYIGSVLTKDLLSQGHTVTVLDNFSRNQKSLLDCCHYKSLEIIRGDCRDANVLKPLVIRADIIIPLAAKVGTPICAEDEIAAITTNVEAIITLLKLRHKSQPIIFPTTNSGYGIGADGIECTEKTPLKPVSVYGQTKVEAEKRILDSGNSITLRLATVFGASPAMRYDLLVNNFVYKAVVDRYVVLYQSHFKRNYIHIQDVSRAFRYCIYNFLSMKDNVYNCGISDGNYSKKELCQEIKKQISNFYFVDAEVGEDVDQRNYIVSNAKIERKGFHTLYSLQDGITELIKTVSICRGEISQGNVPK